MCFHVSYSNNLSGRLLLCAVQLWVDLRSYVHAHSVYLYNHALGPDHLL